MKLAHALLTAAVLSHGPLAADPGEKPEPAAAGQVRPDQPASPGDQLVARGDELQRAGQWQAALQHYRSAEQAGSSAGAFGAGALGLKLAATAKGKAQLLQQAAALRSLYKAATNRHAQACLSLAQAFREGTGVGTDPVQAYAWLCIARRHDTNIPLTTLDRLAVELDVSELETAQATARQWLSGKWPQQVVPEFVQNDSRLRIFGVSRSPATTSVLINRKTFMEGDSAGITPLTAAGRGATPTAASLDLTCVKIGSDYALVRVAGESALRLLAMDVN